MKILKQTKDNWFNSTTTGKLKFCAVILTELVFGIWGIYFAILFAFSIETVADYRYSTFALVFMLGVNLVSQIKTSPKHLEGGNTN